MNLELIVNEISNGIRSQANGRVVRESLLKGPNGALKFETVWDGSKLITGKFLRGR